MTGFIPPEKAESLLEKQDARTPEALDFWRIWKISVCGFGVFCIFGIFAFVMVSAERGYLVWNEMLYVLCSFLLILGAYLYVRIGRAKRFKKSVDKYGRNELINQITHTNSKAFFIEPDNCFGAIVVTPDYLISANDFVIDLKDVRYIEMRKAKNKEMNIRLHKNDCVRIMFRCMYRVWIKTSGGRTIVEGISVRSTDMELFISALKRSAPEAEFIYDESYG